MIVPLLFVQAPAIPLTSAMLVDENGVGGVEALVDEPGVEKPAKPFFAGWKAERYPVSVTIDLGSRCRVERVAIYHESGESTVELSTGQPFSWKGQPVALAGFENWIDVPVGTETRYLRLTLNGPTSIPEIRLFGSRLTPIENRASKPRRQPLPTMDRFIGVNAFIDDPVARIAPPGGFVREYHPATWDVEGADGLLRLAPSAAGGGAWSFDDFYAKLKAAGCEVCPCVWKASAALLAGRHEESKPIEKGADPQAPASYRDQAAHLFQYASRYGARRVDDAFLTLAPGQPRRSGLGLIRWLENWNEPDKSWWGRDPRFDPFELAAMCSADYDGDQGRMGPGFGVKTADPSMSLAMGGLAGLNLEYLKAMKFWSDFHRAGSFPADALNLHHYSSTAGEQGFTKETVALSPEADHLREKLAAIVAWRDAELPGKPVWLSEFGYDTNPKSPLYARPLGTMSSEAVQSAWLVRAYLALAAAGVDRASMFMLRDVDPKDATQFSSSGLVGPKGSWAPKPSWTAVSTLRKTLSGMRFGSEVPTGRADVRVFRFVGSGGRTADVVWCPTSEDHRVKGFHWTGKHIVNLINGASSSSAGSLNVSETPQIVVDAP